MKLSDVSTKLTCIAQQKRFKSNAVRVLASAALAGAVLAATPAAQAQHVSFGVQIGGPVYSRGYYAPPPVVYAPRPVYGYYGFHDREAWLRHEEWLRREQWEREHRFHDYRFDGYRR